MSYFADFFRHEDFLSDLFSLIEQVSSAIITAHTNADPDALASALGLKGLIAQKRPNFPIQIVLPELNKTAANIFQHFNFDSPLSIIEKEWPQHIELMIMVDTSDYEMVGAPYSIDSTKKIIEIDHIVVIDHHHIDLNASIRYDYMHILPDYSSATEIIIEFYRTLQYEPDINIAKFLLAGIITDTGHFRYANARTLDNAKILLDREIKISEINVALTNKMARPEKIARLKAAKRLSDLHYVNRMIVAISHVSSYEASACKALIDLGADIAFVVAFERKKLLFRISGRVREEVIQNFDFHLGKFMTKFGNQWQGSGGGHDGAAGAYGTLESIKQNSNLFDKQAKRPNKQEFDAFFFPIIESKLLKLLREFLL
ncbi:MAG: DHH family phosphoesterase [Candidatus Lokiarchaeota archaeon]|nr:DHH family phosphoesterase [Candidatus Harpocratesius repetitus]